MSDELLYQPLRYCFEVLDKWLAESNALNVLDRNSQLRHCGMVNLAKLWGNLILVRYPSPFMDVTHSDANQFCSPISTIVEQICRGLLHAVIEVGADKAVIVLPREDHWCVEAIATTDQPICVESVPLSLSPEIPHTLINTVRQTLQPTIVDTIHHSTDPYQQQQPKSILGTPILQQGRLVGILYLENQSIEAFTPDRVNLLNLLCAQAACSLETAQLYQRSQDYAQQLARSLQTTQSKQAELKDSKAMLQLVFDNIPGGVFWKDFNSVFLGCNQHIATLAGLDSPDQIVGKTDYDLPWKPEETEFYRHCDRRVMDSGIAEIGIVESQLQANGKQTWLETNKIPLFDAQNQVIGIIGTFQDITDRKAAECTLQQKSQELEQALNNLQQTQLQMIQSEKMSALGNLVAGVAHEINNPIGFLAGNIQPALDYIKDILGLLELYQQEYPTPKTTIQAEIDAIDLEFIREDLPKLINSMRTGIDRIRNISTSLRTFSRADTVDKQPFNLHEGIDSTVLILKHRLKANDTRPEIQVIKHYGDLPLVQCFPGQINQVFMNLLANAIDALEDSNQGKDLTELGATPNCITIHTAQAQTQTIVRIRDNGIGIPDAVKQRIFEHLFTTKAVGKGTGLGLAIAHQIVVEKHNGRLDVQSEVGEGTEFIIQLPSHG